jgi:hypothetical protein
VTTLSVIIASEPSTLWSGALLLIPLAVALAKDARQRRRQPRNVIEGYKKYARLYAPSRRLQKGGLAYDFCI